MDDRDRDSEIADLRQQLSTLKAKLAALTDECVRLADWIHEIRKEFGNPFYYSRPEEPHFVGLGHLSKKAKRR
jgi:hypothetical protein